MKKLSRVMSLLLIVGLVATAVHIVSAQQAQRQGRQRQMRDREMDPEEMMRRSMDRTVEQLNLSEEEATVLKPRIEAILRARFQQSSEMRELTNALQEAIDAKDDEQIKAKLEEVKAKRKENKAKMEALEKELIELLTVTQEAQLTISGVVNSDGFGGFRFGGFGRQRQGQDNPPTPPGR